MRWTLLICTLTACGSGGDDAIVDSSPPEVDAQPADATPALSDLDKLRALVAELPALAPADQTAAIDAFVVDVEYGGHGFPIRDEGALAVVWQGTGDVTVAGDFDAWDAAAHPLEEPAAGFHYVIVDSVPETGRSLYKLVQSDTYFADPIARRFGWDDFGEYSLADVDGSQSHLERWPRFSQSVGALEPRAVTVWLPAGYEGGSDRLPVLYMQDGQNLFAPDAIWGGWQVGQAAGAVGPVLIVGIDNTSARMDEYTPDPDMVGGSIVGGRADEYGDFLVGGVKPFIDARYRTEPGRESTAVLGSSLGGLVSVWLARRDPDVFGRAGSMSGTFGWGQFLETFPSAPPTGVTFYLDSGGGPGTGCPDDGSDNYCETQALADTLRALGWQDGVDLTVAWDPGAPHNEASWAARLPALLQAWYPP